MQTLTEIYGGFGPKVLDLVRTQIQLHGTLAPLLRQLNLTPPASLQEQHKSLRAFIYQYGIAFFLKAADQGTNPMEIERLKVQKLLRSSSPEERVDPTRARQQPSSGRHQQAHRRRASDRDGYGGQAYGPAPPADQVPRRRANDFVPQNEGQPLPAQDKPKTINVPGYSGPDRRSGTDRRKGDERRSRLDIVFKNKRYGGDRRKTARRADDRRGSGRK